MSRTSAERTRRYRERQLRGVACIVRVPIYCNALLAMHRIAKPNQRRRGPS